MKLRSLLFIILAALLISIVGRDRSNIRTHDYSKRKIAIVHRVIDGDTIQAYLNGRQCTIRFIGIDAPESSDNLRAKKFQERTKETTSNIIKMGKAATKYVESFLSPGTRISLEYDIRLTDKYDRTLAYVYLESGEMFNQKIAYDGFAYPLTIPPNVKYSKQLAKAAASAQSNSRGLWAQKYFNIKKYRSAIEE